VAITNLEPAEARHIVSKHRCSDCWEVLQEHYNEHTRTSTVSCSTPDCPCRGHVSAKFVENALAESRLKRREAERALGECGAVAWIPKPVRRSEEVILAELGY
jgi:hypothetical protein